MCKPLDPVWRLLAKEAGVRAPHVYMTWAAMRAEKAKFHPASFADFCDLQLRHIEAIMEALDAHGMLEKAVPKVTNDKGQRLPADFAMPSDWLLWAQTERGWTLDVAKTEADAFTDFWHSKPGAGGVKLDWRATWRNWVRNSRKANGDWKPNTTAAKPVSLQERIALYRKIGRDYEADELEKEMRR